jgi:DNA-binding HxlR family transcriptional regulator
MDNTACISKTLKIIGAKWTINILHQLCEKTRRFNELQHSLPGISPKTLSHRLTQLEKDGIVKKKIYAQVPPRVEYSLTPKGSSLRSIIDQMRRWGESH